MSSSYGYTDEQIGDLPLGRFRQITAAIQLRKWQESRVESARLSWQTRVLAQYISAGYMTEKGQDNPALDSAATLGFDDIERALMKVPATTTAAPAENSTGSFERLMGFAGGMNKR